jgi:hypothetical protein
VAAVAEALEERVAREPEQPGRAPQALVPQVLVPQVLPEGVRAAVR